MIRGWTSTSGAAPQSVPSSSFTDTHGSAALVPYSSNVELPNPLRGQYNWLMTGTAGYWQGTSYSDSVSYQRYAWANIQTSAGSGGMVYTAIDADIATAAAAGQRFIFQIMFGQPGSNTTVPSWATSASPSSFQSFAGDTFPVWNDATYLGYAQTVINALGARYDLDERVAWFEFSGYGDWSECHVGWEEQNGLTVPTTANTISVMGYYTNQGLSEQIGTSATFTTLLQCHVSAWPNTRLMLYVENPEIIRQAMTGKNFAGTTLSGVTHAAGLGLRFNHWGVYEQNYVPAGWMGDTTDNTDVIALMNSSWQTMPWATEWNGGSNNTSVLAKCLDQTINWHLSTVPSYPQADNFTPALPFSTSDYAIFLRNILYRGYRYSATASVTSGGAVTVTWTNWAVAPAYESWQIQYLVRNSGSTTVQTVNSSYSFLTLSAAAQSYSNTGGTTGDPVSITGTDTFTLNSQSSGSYTIWVQVNWNQHKPSATHTVNHSPMALAMASRDGGGAYQIGSFTC